MKSSHAFIVRFGDNSTRKGIALHTVEDDDIVAELCFADLVTENGRTLALGDTVPQDVDSNIFLALRFQEKKDWDNFVNIINHHDKRYKRGLEERTT